MINVLLRFKRDRFFPKFVWIGRFANVRDARIFGRRNRAPDVVVRYRKTRN